MESTNNNDGMHFVSRSTRRETKSQNYMFRNSELELELNDVTVDFILVTLSSTNDKVDIDGWNPRRVFEEEIKKVGLLLEEDIVDELVFIKIHAPIKVLRKYCGIMKLRMPIKRSLVNNSEEVHMNNDYFGRFTNTRVSNVFESKILTSEYSNEMSYLFDEDNPDFFSEEVRILVIDFILNKINWGKEKNDLNTVGFQRLIDKDVYKAAYSMHDGGCDSEDSCRHKLLTVWASIDKCLHRQPIDQVKDYMGAKYAFYFAWLGFYSYMLIPPAIMGSIVILYGIITLPSSKMSSDICNATNIIMCPLCDNCDYWQLSTACLYGKLSYLFDNNLTVIFAFLMSIWATLFLEMWKRYASSITHHWGLINLNLDSVHPRPQYLSKLSNYNHIKNVMTGEIEPIAPMRRKMFALFISYSILLLFVLISISLVFAVEIYQMVMVSSSLAKNYKFTNIDLFISFTSGILNLFCIQLLNWVYKKIAVFLTEMELPRTQQEFDETLQVKIYIFEFINYYISIIYITFWKGKWIGYPGEYLRIFNYRQEECSPGGCLMMLSIQLFIIMVGKQVEDVIIEIIFPVCIKWFYSMTKNLSHLKRQNSSSETEDLVTEKKPWLEDYKLLDLGPRGLLPEYLAMILQYGFVTLFVTAFPLGPLFALLNNMFELRLDATKFLKDYRRPIPHRVSDIGAWYQILDIIGIISVVTNAIIIAFNTNFIPRLVYMAYVNVNHTDEGFLNYSLAYFDVNDLSGKGPSDSSFINVTECRYQDYREGKSDHYKRTPLYYQLLIARLIFVVLFQNVVYFIKIIIQWLIPDVPKSLNDRIKRESYLITRMIIKREVQRENTDISENGHKKIK